MLRAQHIIGKSIVASNSGEQIGAVKDLVFDHEAHRLLGFLTNRGGWSGSARVLPWSAALTVGSQAIIVRSGDRVVEASSIPRIKEVLESGKSLLGELVVTADGKPVGTLSDVLFDKGTGVVKGYEIVDGTQSDKSTSRLFLPAPLALTFANGVVRISPEVSELIERSRFQPFRQPEMH